MRILDNYITKSIVKIFTSTILIFCFLYILIDLATHLEDFISNKVPWSIVASYYASFFPLIFSQTAPIACLLATLFTYSNLNNNNEIIALRASGLDFWKITRPAIIFGLMAAALVFLVNERFVPQSLSITEEIKSDKIQTSASQRKTESRMIKRLCFFGINNRLYFIDQYDPSTKTIEGITVIGRNEHQQMTEKIVAIKGVWTGSAWKLTNCQIAKYNPLDPTATNDIQFYKEKIVEINETPADISKQRNSIQSMNIRELKDTIKRFKGSGATAALNGLKVDLHQKIAYPFACIVIIFAGLPFTLITGRRKGVTFASVGIALIIGFLFYVVNAVGLAMGKGGALSPILSAWVAPMIFIAAGFYSIKKLF